MLIQLIGNLGAVAFIVSAWMNYRSTRLDLTKFKANLIFGCVMGLASIVSMLLSVQWQGYYFNLAGALVGLAGALSGPTAFIGAALLAIVYRSGLGGPGLTIGLLLIFVSGMWGLVLYRVSHSHLKIGLLASAIGLSYGGVALANGASLSPVILMLSSANAVTALICGLTVISFKSRIRERGILEAAIRKAPDYCYTKDTDGRYLFANYNLAEALGRRLPEELVGLSDAELFDAATAARSKAVDQRILTTGEPSLDLEQFVNNRWYSTSKIAIRDADDVIVGIVGVTHDVTRIKELEAKIVESHMLLERAIAAISDGIAVFTATGHLALCNEPYIRAFPLSSSVRRPGAHITDILRAVARSGERGTSEDEAWIASEAARLFTDHDDEIHHADGRWLSLQARVGADGSVLCHVRDITDQKTLHVQAITDPLTGLLNRRAFDAGVGDEACSLLFVDVDHFKAFNDCYGHAAGDKVLKLVADCLRQTAGPADIVARYGGEEFAVLMPGAGLAQAVAFADQFRDKLKSLAIPGPVVGHVVTASVGVALRSRGLSVEALFKQADDALYSAKRSGRDRTVAAPEVELAF